MRKLFLLLSGMIAALAACGTPGPPAVYDWCYRFDFTVDDPFNAGVGSWEYLFGYVTDDYGNLNLTYDSPVYIQPTTLQARIVRLVGGDISIETTGEVFGIDTTTEAQTLPGVVENYVAQIGASSAGQGSYTVNFTLHASDDVALEYLELFGIYDNPFGASNCGGFEDTPTSAPTNTRTDAPTRTRTFTPSPTLTPSNTFTPSNTPTVTNTPDFDWCYEFDFTSGTGGWAGYYHPTVSGYTAIYSASNGWDNNAMQSRIQIVRSIPASTLTEISATLSGTLNGNLHQIGFNFTEAGYAYYSATTSATHNFSPSALGVTNLFIDVVADAQYWGTPVTPYLIGVRLKGNGTDPGFYGTGVSSCLPPTETPTATPSTGPTATITPSLTRTPRPTFTPGTRTSTLTPSRTLLPVFPTTPPTVIPSTNTSTLVMTSTVTPGPGTPSATAPDPSGTPVTATGTGTPVIDLTAVGDFTTIGGGAAAVSTNLFNLTLGYLENITGVFNGIVDAWYNTSAQAPPGMPLCKTQPLQSEWCAILYILTYTLFSGEIGKLILQVGVIAIDLFILFTFIRLGRAILARAAEITKT
jgi:hypothetical protein